MTILLHPTAYRAADEQLVELVRAGDDRAFDAIHARYEQRLLGYARQMLGGAHHDAEEVVQDAFVRALPRCAPTTARWPSSLALHDRAQPRPRRAAPPDRTTDLELHAPVLADAGADPHDRVTARRGPAQPRRRAQAPARAPAPALVPHELGGASHEAIGRRLRVSTGGSKALVSRARSGLTAARTAPPSGRRLLSGAVRPRAVRGVEEDLPHAGHPLAQLAVDLARGALDLVGAEAVGQVDPRRDQQPIGRQRHRQQLEQAVDLGLRLEDLA